MIFLNFNFDQNLHSLIKTLEMKTDKHPVRKRSSLKRRKTAGKSLFDSGNYTMNVKLDLDFKQILSVIYTPLQN